MRKKKESSKSNVKEGRKERLVTCLEVTIDAINTLVP